MAQTIIDPKNMGIYLTYKKLGPGPQNWAHDPNKNDRQNPLKHYL